MKIVNRNKYCTSINQVFDILILRILWSHFYFWRMICMGLLCDYTWLRIVRVVNYFMRYLFLLYMLNYFLFFILNLLLVLLMDFFYYRSLLSVNLWSFMLYLSDYLRLNSFLLLSILLFYLLLWLLSCFLRRIISLKAVIVYILAILSCLPWFSYL